jgi:hypothetical protein
MPESTLELEVQVLVFKEGESWIAQGLNYDITGHGQSLNDVIDNFWHTLICQIVVDIKHGDRPLGNIKPAPKFYWQRLEQTRAKRFVEKKNFTFPDGVELADSLELPDSILPAYMISAQADLGIAA